jgi:hypothetical protein
MMKIPHRLITTAIALTIIAFSLSGCGGAITTATTALKIAAVKAILDKGSDSSNTLVRILADIISGNVLKEAVALITKPDGGGTAEIILTLNDDGKYEGSYVAETSPTETTEYSVEVAATDLTGESAVSEPIKVEVPAESD